jgi:hypothetical protein
MSLDLSNAPRHEVLADEKSNRTEAANPGGKFSRAVGGVGCSLASWSPAGCDITFLDLSSLAMVAGIPASWLDARDVKLTRSHQNPYSWHA